MKTDPIDKLLDFYVASGKIDESTKNGVRRLLIAQGKDTLAQAAAKVYKDSFGNDEHYQGFVSTAKTQKYWFTYDDHTERSRENLDKIISKSSIQDDKDYRSVIDHLDTTEDADLLAAFWLNIPEIRQKIKEEIGSYDNLYRVSRSVLKDKKKQKYKPDLNDSDVCYESSQEDVYDNILNNLPEGHFDDLRDEKNIPEEKRDEFESKKRLFMILREKARRDSFKKFGVNNDPVKGVANLEEFVNIQTNRNLRFLYEDQLRIFRDYLEFQDEVNNMGYINEEFRNPVSGEKGVIPSFHQTVALYHNLDEKRFGVFDDCGTGKTAIAALLKPLVERKKREEGKKVHGRTLIIGPRASSKAWKDALQGEEDKRYFKRKQKMAWVIGEKNDKSHAEMEDSDFIFVNYEQLCLDFEVGGKTRKVYEVLMNLGYDNVIVDEVQDSKNTRNTTSKGKSTESLAVRLLTTNFDVEYVSLLSGTPMPDNLNDYANILFILKSEYFVKEVDGRKKLDFNDIEKRFKEIYESDPRALYTLTRQNTIRRRTADVTNLPGTEEIEDMIELTPVQREIVDYIFESGQKDWLTQIRYAVLDPRLVSPIILQDIGLVGKISRKDSSKYRRLEEILTANDGPIAKGEKAVIFSSMFAEGVTRDVKGLEEEYSRLGLEKEYQKLGLRPLKEDLEKNLSQKFGRSVEFVTIDGTSEMVDREVVVDKLLNNGVDGVICTTQSGGVSLNFSAASTGIFLDRHYSPATTEQAVARIARRGQRQKARIYFLSGYDSIDIDVKDLVEQKSENIKMALDSVELLEKEKEILWGNKDKERLKDLFLKRRGGIAIDLSRYEVSNIDDFETRKVSKRRGKNGQVIVTGNGNLYDSTIAQEIRKSIADDPVNCWHDEKFVRKYFDHFESLSPYLLARAKVIDLVKRARNEELAFPKLLLADGAGPGILYTALQDLDSLIMDSGLNLPLVVDRDSSKPMHDLSPNRHKYLADMCGDPRVFDEEFFERFGKFDFVDNSSLTLLPNKSKMRDYILEANRVLDVSGHLQLGIGGWHYSKEFFEGMKRAGFEPRVKSVRHGVSKSLLKDLKKQFGQHYAEAYASKLASSTFSIFQKVDEVSKVDDKYFLLENPSFIEERKLVVTVDKPNEKTREVIKHKSSEEKSSARSGRKKKPKKYTGTSKLVVDGRTGLVKTEI